MTAVDTSVIVAAFASWHESHAVASRALDGRPALPAHCALETYSVLTRLPAPHRVAADLVARFLASAFPDRPLVLPPETLAGFPGRLAALGVAGGAAYDALVGATAEHHAATLLTLDQRALTTYRRLGVSVRVL